MTALDYSLASLADLLLMLAWGVAFALAGVALVGRLVARAGGPWQRASLVGEPTMEPTDAATRAAERLFFRGETRRDPRGRMLALYAATPEPLQCANPRHAADALALCGRGVICEPAPDPLWVAMGWGDWAPPRR